MKSRDLSQSAEYLFLVSIMFFYTVKHPLAMPHVATISETNMTLFILISPCFDCSAECLFRHLKMNKKNPIWLEGVIWGCVMCLRVCARVRCVIMWTIRVNTVLRPCMQSYNRRRLSEIGCLIIPRYPDLSLPLGMLYVYKSNLSRTITIVYRNEAMCSHSLATYHLLVLRGPA